MDDLEVPAPRRDTIEDLTALALDIQRDADNIGKRAKTLANVLSFHGRREDLQARNRLDAARYRRRKQARQQDEPDEAA